MAPSSKAPQITYLAATILHQGFKGSPAEYKSANPPGSSRPPVQNDRVSDELRRNNRPAPEVQTITQVKQAEANALGSSHLPTRSTRILAPKNPPGPGVQRVTQTKNHSVNPSGSSRPPVKFAPVFTPNNVPE